jgi:hypothetical protein
MDSLALDVEDAQSFANAARRRIVSMVRRELFASASPLGKLRPLRRRSHGARAFDQFGSAQARLHLTTPKPFLAADGLPESVSG